MSKTATQLKVLDGFVGDARLYKLDPPLQEESWDDDDAPEEWEYVVVSAAVAMFSGPETYIFGADKSGKVVAWGELSGSYRGGLSHSEALSGAGYSVQ